MQMKLLLQERLKAEENYKIAKKSLCFTETKRVASRFRRVEDSLFYILRTIA